LPQRLFFNLLQSTPALLRGLDSNLFKSCGWDLRI